MLSATCASGAEFRPFHTGRSSSVYWSQLRQAAEAAGGLYAEAVGAGLQSACVNYPVLAVEGGGNVGHADSALRHECLVDVDFYRTVLDAEEFHLGHVLHAQQLVLDALGLVFQFAVGACVAAEAVEHTQYVAEVIVHYRRPGTGRQLALHVAYLAAQLVPQLLHGVGAYFLFHVDGNLRQAGPNEMLLEVAVRVR